MTRLQSQFLVTRARLESGWKKWLLESTRVTFFTEWFESQSISDSMIRVNSSTRVIILVTRSRIELRWEKRGLDSTRITFFAKWLDSIRVTINDSRLQSESCLQNLWVLDGQIHFVGTQKIEDFCFSNDQDWRKFCLFGRAQRWSRGRSAGVDSGRSLRFLPKPEHDPEADFGMKTGPGAGAGVIISVFTGVG